MEPVNPFSYQKIVFFTDAGMSQESGIPTYRGQGGLITSEESYPVCLRLRCLDNDE